MCDGMVNGGDSSCVNVGTAHIQNPMSIVSRFSPTLAGPRFCDALERVVRHLVVPIIVF